MKIASINLGNLESKKYLRGEIVHKIVPITSKKRKISIEKVLKHSKVVKKLYEKWQKTKNIDEMAEIEAKIVDLMLD